MWIWESKDLVPNCVMLSESPNLFEVLFFICEATMIIITAVSQADIISRKRIIEIKKYC